MMAVVVHASRAGWGERQPHAGAFSAVERALKDAVIGHAGTFTNAAVIDLDVYLKTSSKQKYTARTQVALASWAMDVPQLTIMSDDSDRVANQRLRAQLLGLGVDDRISVVPVEGTQRFNDYKTEAGADREGGEAQHRKTRAVLRMFAERVAGPANKHSYPDDGWACYIDDDMLVDVANLRAELARLRPTCTPNCMVGDLSHLSGVWYTAGAWCMERALALRAHRVLERFSDTQLGWQPNDDVAFAIVLTSSTFGINAKYTNSTAFVSEFSKYIEPCPGMWPSPTPMDRNKPLITHSLLSGMRVLRGGGSRREHPLPGSASAARARPCKISLRAVGYEKARQWSQHSPAFREAMIGASAVFYQGFLPRGFHAQQNEPDMDSTVRWHNWMSTHRLQPLSSPHLQVYSLTH